MIPIFFEIARILGIRESFIDILFEKIMTKYSEPNRHYHNFRHIEKMWKNISSYIGNSNKFSLLALATIYHDLIYDTESKTNEVDSFQELEKDFGKQLLEHELVELKNLILGTKSHELLEESFEHELFLDSDLLILGSEKKEYIEYRNSIRKEYFWVNEATYKKERIKVLENFLDRKNIYFSYQMQRLHEENARENLKDEIKYLKGLNE